jgi:hypothetical protein
MGATVDLGKIAGNLVKNATTGESVRLDSFWKETSCVLHFMRRFG